MVVGLLISLAGCSHTSTTTRGGSGDIDPFDDSGDTTRETILIEPTKQTGSFDVSPAVFDTAIVRIDTDTGTPAIVDVLVKGSFPEGCFELNALDQDPMPGGQRVTLTMRRPSEAICTQVVRPYRFFFTLDRRFDRGRYTLLLNERAFPFEVTSAAK